jgi:hypothetical protein
MFNGDMETAALSAAIDELVGMDPTGCTDAESMVELERQLARLEGYVCAASAAFETSGDWSIDGARTAPAWMATRCHLPMSVARRQVRLGRALRHLPETSRAWLDGEISGSHVEALAGLRRPKTEEFLARDEGMLIRQATRLRFEHFLRALAYWEQRADPDGAEETDEEKRARRDVYLVPSYQNMYLGKITLDPISGAIVSGELERLDQELFEADWTKARLHLGRDPLLSELERTGAQRRADALVEMAIRSASTPAGARRPEPLFTVFVGYETLAGRICELAQGQAITPGSLVPWIEHSWLERAVFEPGGRVDVSSRARFFTGGTRRALEVRDRQCTHPYCDAPAEHCQGDHIIEYTKGGPTTQENGRLLCGFHNRLRNKGSPSRQDE